MISSSRLFDKSSFIILGKHSEKPYSFFLTLSLSISVSHRTKKRLEKHKMQIQELREMAMHNNNNTNNNNNNKNRESSMRGRTYSNISLDKEAYNRHEINKGLMDEDGSEFVGFKNEMFHPLSNGKGDKYKRNKSENTTSTSNIKNTKQDAKWNKGRRPSIGPSVPGNEDNRSHPGLHVHQQPRASVVSFEFPAPPFQLLNPLFKDPRENESVRKHETIKNTSQQQQQQSSPPPPPPPPPQPLPPSNTTNGVRSPRETEGGHPSTNSLEQYNKQQQQQGNSLDSLLGEFKKKIKTTNETGEHTENALEEGRLVRASTFSKNTSSYPSPTHTTQTRSQEELGENNEDPSTQTVKQRAMTFGNSKNMKRANKKKPRDNNDSTPWSRNNVIHEEASAGNEFMGFRNRTFNPDFQNEASSRF